MTRDPDSLDFDDDAGASRSTWIAAGILVAVVLWMGSGYIFPSEDDRDETSQSNSPQAVSVATRNSTAEPITLYFQAEGQAEPDRDSPIRAEISGEVAEVLVSKGSNVSEGEVIARLSTTRLEADLNRAQEELDRARREFENAEELLDRGVATVDRVSAARAALASARAARTNAEEALNSARIEAPFAGRIERLTLDTGEFISAGTEVGRIVDNQPLSVALQVPQRALNALRGADKAQVTFITGEVREGTLGFVSTAAQAETRTFLAEVTVPNDDGEIPAGISAEIRIPTGQVQAHFVSPSIVSLNEEGRIGVKTVEDETVVFYNVEVVRAEVDGIWVTGLPDQVDLITIGQGYVSDGEPVRAAPETETSTAPGQ